MNFHKDDELIARLQAGDTEAFNELYKKYYKPFLFTACRLTNNIEDAKDAVQSAFIQMFISIKNLKDPKYFRLWMNKIIRGKCIDLFQKNKDVILDTMQEEIINLYEEQNTDFIPHNKFKFTADQDILMNLINQLPNRYQEILFYAYFYQFSMKEISDLLEIPTGTVKSRLYTAKKTLKEMILLYNEQHAEAPLNFKSASLSAALSAVLLSDFQKTMPVSLSTAKSYHHGNSHTFMQILLSTACCVAVSYAGFFYYSNRSHSTDEVVKNESVIYRNRIVNTSKEAYFLLRNWAVDERQLRSRDSEEIAEAKKLYEFLKANNDAYYEVLVNDGWTHDFESLLK